MPELSCKDLGITGKIFCISMQRSGTSSVGDFLQQFGFGRAGSQISNKRRWPQYWLAGNFPAILSDPVFVDTDVLEDDPWWFPEFYKYLYHALPDSRFILLHRDGDSWFKSMIRHSNGYSIGNTELHAKIYRREHEYFWLKDNIQSFGKRTSQEMVLYDKPDHYIRIYEQFNREAQDFFNTRRPDALFCENLGSNELWSKLAQWLQLPHRDNANYSVHTHKSKGTFTQDNILQKKQSDETP